MRIFESKDRMSLSEFCDMLNVDEDYKNDFRDWVRSGIHGRDILSYDRWMEIFDDFADTFGNKGEPETEFDYTTKSGEKISFWKAGGKWRTSNGMSFMGYLTPDDIIYCLNKSKAHY